MSRAAQPGPSPPRCLQAALAQAGNSIVLCSRDPASAKTQAAVAEVSKAHPRGSEGVRAAREADVGVAGSGRAVVADAVCLTFPRCVGRVTSL